MPRSHPLGFKNSIDVSELANHQLLLLRQSFLTRQLFDQACESSRLIPKILLESNSAQALLALVNAGQGIGILPSTVRLGNVRHKFPPSHAAPKALNRYRIGSS
jgi:DNA-binding transcriptional LysR family regulator